MAKDNLSVSLGLIGMNKSTHPHLLDEKAYTHARNANLDTDLEGMALTNEHSNILCNKLFGSNGKEQVIVGYEYDGVNQRMILFLTDKEPHLNPLYDENVDVCGVNKYVRQSQIGYIPITNNVEEESDLELECGCDILSMLSKPLEEFEEYVETCKYTQIISDCADSNYCLNFDPNYPVKDIVLKQEACGTTMTFASKNNPPRYINLDKIEDYKYKGRKSDCEEPESVCLDCDKLRLFPEFEPMNIVPHMMMYGGNLRMGKYEFYVAYCDRSGRELTEYISATNHVHIFDIRNRRRDATELHDRTTSGIHLKINDIDDRFNYLKVVVGEITAENKDASYYVVGVYPTSVTDVYYTSNSLDTSEAKHRITPETIVAEKPVYKYFGGLTTSNGYLFGYDYEVQKEINLQKVASLMGSFLKWRTLEAGEDLYNDGVNNALYRGYFRDEVYPFGIRFRLKNGYKTRVFHLVSRPPLSTDVADAVKNTDVLSILDNSGDCFGSVREKHWQFYNTAEELGLVTDFVGRGPVKIIGTDVTNDCVNPEAIVLENGSIEMNISEEYRDLGDWIRRYSEEIVNTTDPDSQYYSSDLKAILTTPSSAMCNMEDIFGSPICDDGSCIDKYCDPLSPFYNESTCMELSSLCDDSGKCHSVCETPTPVKDSGVLSLEEIKEKSTTKLERKLPSESGDAPEYVHKDPPKDCQMFSATGSTQSETQSVRTKLGVNFNEFQYKGEDYNLDIDYRDVYERIPTMDNLKCSESYPIGRACNYFVPSQVIHMDLFARERSGNRSEYIYYTAGVNGATTRVDGNYNPDNAKNLIYSDKNALGTDRFHNKLSLGALWYHVEFEEGEDEVILEITPGSKKDKFPDVLETKYVRITTYRNCKDGDYVHSAVYDIKDGYWLRLKKSDYGEANKIYIALDTEIVKVTGSNQYLVEYNTFDISYLHTSFVTGSPSVSFSVLKRDKEYYKQMVEYEKLRFSYTETYIARCMYRKSTSNDPDCEPIGHKEGMFSYWESTVNYPNNCDLFDSSGLNIDVDRLSKIATGNNRKLFDTFSKYYVEDGVTNANANLTNKPIRHFKFPDNTVAPFINTGKKLKFDSSMIYPMGVTIDDAIVNFFLDEAVRNNLIDSCTRDNIVSYEIFSGERHIKSVISRGLLHDMYQADDELTGGKVYFRNFPYNTLGKNTYLTKTMNSRDLIEHPFGSTSNNRFSFVSPEVYTDSGGLQATEMTFDGYQYGESDTTWVDVEEHSKWVILGDKAKRQANTFAWLEAAFEFASVLSMMVIEASKNNWMILGQSSGSNKVGVGKAMLQIAAFSAVQGVNIFLFKRPQYEMQWLNIAEDNGPVVNHAEYSVSGRGHYNRFQPNKEYAQKLRGIDKLMFLNNGREATMEDTGLPTYITNIDRENSIYLYLGQYNVEYPPAYVNWDNYDVSPKKSSRVTVGDLRLCHVKRPTHTGNIASPYVTLKRYVPDQYGGIDSVRWVHTGHIKKFGSEGSYTFFGGDAYITRVDFKNKYRLFHTDAIEMANRSPFNYKDQTVIGGPKYYVNYKTETKLGNILKTEYFADTEPQYLDCFSGKEFYIRDWERFYLFVYGTPYFMVESTINGEFRYAGKEPYEQFASQGIDMIWHTQEINVPIHTPVRFNYDSIYSARRVLGLVGTSLDSLFDQKLSDCWAESENGVAWSEMDNSEVSYNDPWLVFRPGNIYRFPFSFGRLVGLDNIESNVVVGRFTNNATLFNSVDQLRDRVTADNENIGTGGIFASGRPVQFSYTQLGETGSQHRDFISTEFGHFFVDARRGKVLKLATNGQGLEAISDLKGTDESGMRRWFKKHLPFKILKGEIAGLTEEDLDNKYKGLGISLGWDSRFKRLFVTKLDYMVRRKYRGKISYSGGNFYLSDSQTEISLQDSTYFKNVSWTIAYSAIYQCWLSFYDFKPDLYFSYDNYFQTVINYAGEYHKNRGIWSHLLTNKSYQVFYGDYYPFEIETIIKNTNTQNVLKDLKVWTYSHRYHDNFDYAQWRKKSFNKLVVHNQTNNSGLLHLNYDDSIHAHKFPRPISRTEQEIKATHSEEQLSINYFYNRVKNEESGLPIWKSDENNIHSVLNPDVISFDSKKVLERLRGDWFKVLLIQDNTSQFKQVFKWQMNREQSYQ